MGGAIQELVSAHVRNMCSDGVVINGSLRRATLSLQQTQDKRYDGMEVPSDMLLGGTWASLLELPAMRDFEAYHVSLSSPRELQRLLSNKTRNHQVIC